MTLYTARIVIAGTPLECSRCNQEFPAPRDLERTAFAGAWAARITTMLACPNCEAVDAPWVDSKHLIPPHDPAAGTYHHWKMRAKHWLQEN